MSLKMFKQLAAIAIPGIIAMSALPSGAESIFVPTGAQLNIHRFALGWDKPSTKPVSSSNCVLRQQVAKVNWKQLFPDAKTVSDASDAPWSEPAILVDTFNGEQTIMVRDRDYQRDILSNNPHEYGILSVFTPAIINFTYFYVDASETIKRTAVSAEIRIAGTIYKLPLEPYGFLIQDDVAQALMDSDDVAVRAILDTGRKVDFQIGKKTISAWRTIRSKLDTRCS
jgi:hypothetical protein